MTTVVHGTIDLTEDQEYVFLQAAIRVVDEIQAASSLPPEKRALEHERLMRRLEHLNAELDRLAANRTRDV